MGQDLFLSASRWARIVNLVDEGLVALFIVRLGALNIQPRIDGAKQAIEDLGEHRDPADRDKHGVAEERSRIEAWYNGHQDVAGMFAVDAGAPAPPSDGATGLHDKGVRAGGYDLLPEIFKLIKAGHMDFTDQQPYLQGFFPVMQLYLYNISGGVTGPAETNTGLIFITPEMDPPRDLVALRGDSEAQKIVKAPS